MKLFKNLIMLIIIIGMISCVDKKQVRTGTKSRIFDAAHLLNENQKDSIFQLIDDLEKNIGSQIAVIIVDSLNGEGINQFALNEFEKLKLGRAKYDDGILLIVALREREMRIEVGYGLEKIIRDEIAWRINSKVIAPRFTEGKYGQGIFDGVDTLKKLIEKDKALVGKRWEEK